MASYIFQCKKCGLTIQKDSFSPPSSTGCTCGGVHSWTHTRV